MPNIKTMHAPKKALIMCQIKFIGGSLMALLQNEFLIALGSWKAFIYKLFAYGLELLTISYTLYWK